VGESGNREELNKTDIRTEDREKPQVHYVTNMMTKNLDNGEKGVRGVVGVSVGWGIDCAGHQEGVLPENFILFIPSDKAFFPQLSNYMS
jgi:hypothetical protein